MKKINENTQVGYDNNGIPILAEQLTKWAYNQLTIAPELLEACKKVLDIINSYSHIPAQFKACQILIQAINKAEGRIEK